MAYSIRKVIGRTRSVSFLHAFIFGMFFLSVTAFAQNEIRALIVVTNIDVMPGAGKLTGYSVPDAAYAYKAFREAGLTIDFASPRGGKASADPAGIDTTDDIVRDFIRDITTQGTIENTIPSKQIKPELYKIIFFAGGNGALWDFIGDQPIAAAASKIFHEGGIIAANGQGASILLLIKDLKGNLWIKDKRVTSSTDEEEENDGLSQDLPFSLETALRRSGAYFFKTFSHKSGVVPEDRLITGQNRESAGELANDVVERFKQIIKEQNESRKSKSEK